MVVCVVYVVVCDGCLCVCVVGGRCDGCVCMCVCVCVCVVEDSLIWLCVYVCVCCSG